MYYRDVVYRHTVQMCCTDVLYRCTLGVPPPGAPPAAPHPDQPDWFPVHHTGCGHREVHLNIKVLTGLAA